MTKKPRPEHQRFALEYITNGMNATQAYLAVHPKAANSTARQEGVKYLAKPHTQAFVKTFLDQNTISAAEVLARLEMIARASAADWLSFGADGKPYADLKKLEDAGLLCIVKGIKHTQWGVNVEFHDSVHALELLGKYHKLFTDRVSLENADGTPLVISVNVAAAPPRAGLEGIDD